MHEHIRGFNYYIACAPDEPGAIEIEWKDEDGHKVRMYITPVDFVDALRAYADAIERSNGEPRYTVWQQVPDDYTADAVETEASYRSASLASYYDKLGIKPRRFIEVDFVPRSFHVQTSELMTVNEVATTYGLQPGTVRRSIHQGYINAQKSGAFWLVRRADAEARWGKRD